jgi:peptide/nickel transport system substrate-binding protein
MPNATAPCRYRSGSSPSNSRRHVVRRFLVSVLSVVVVAATATSMSACSVGGSASASPDDSFVSALYLEPKALDPHRQVFWETYRVSRNIFEPLVGEDLTTTSGVPDLEPVLATDWHSSDDGRTWTFGLRKGVTFHDGTPFTAASVEKNLRRVTDPDYEYYDEKSAGTAQLWFGDLASYRIVDDHTFSFTFNQPFLGFPRILAQSMYTLPIGNPAVWEKYGNDGFADHPEGTGPYTFTSRTIGDRIDLSRNENYWGTEPKSTHLTFRVIPNNQTRVASLLNDEVDQISYVQPDDVKMLEAKGFQVPQGTAAELIYFSFNARNPAFLDPRVREAVDLGIDRRALADEVFNGYATPQGTFFPPGNEAHSEAEEGRPYDPDTARRLLSEAGHPAGSLHINLVIDVANEALGQWLQAELRDIGIDADVVSLDRASYSDRQYNPAPDDGLYIDEFGETDAEWLYNVVNGLTNRGLDLDGFPDVTSSIDRALHTNDAAARIGLWQDAERTVRSHTLALPAVNLNRYYALGKDVSGFTFASTNWYDLAPVTRGDNS